MADNIALALGKTVLDGFQGAFGEGSASVNNSGITKGAANAIPLHLQPDVAGGARQSGCASPRRVGTCTRGTASI